MMTFFRTMLTFIRPIWRFTSAGVAVVLILAALFVGYQIGRPAAPEVDPDETTAVEVVDTITEYTCSMHPTVRLLDPKAKCPICFMDLIPVSQDSGASPNQLVLDADAVRRSAVETSVVGRFFPLAKVRLYGKLGYDETSVARITAYFSGRLDRLFVNYVGITVAEGDHVAEIYSPDLLAAAADLRQSRIAVDDSAESTALIREMTEQTLLAARERLRLLGLNAEQIEAAERGTMTGERLTIYTPIGGVVTHLAAREGDYVQTGSPIATVADLSRLWLDLEAYESQLSLLRWGQRVEFTVTGYPGRQFEGRIAFIEPIVDDRTRTVAVRVAVDNHQGDLKPGMFASAVVRPRVAAGGAVVSDELAGRWVAPMHPTVVRDGPGLCEICGMDLVSAESLGVVGDPDAVEMPLVIPRSAVMQTGTRAVVYISVPNTEAPTYEGREIVLGSRTGDFFIVESGLKEGEEVVVNGAFRIDSAMQIRAKPSMMMPPGVAGATTLPSATDGRFDVPDSFTFALKPVYSAYLDVQEALADDDLGRFHQAAGDLETALDLVDELGVVGSALGTWRRNAARLRIGGAVTTIADARLQFHRMSKSIIVLERRFGHLGSQTWHIAHCPMAFDNEGAEWLQRGTVIDNPYFGSEMLLCGSLRDAFAPRTGQDESTRGDRP